MSNWKIIQQYQKSRTPLLEGQAVIVANHNHFGIYAQTKSGVIDECCLTFKKDDLESITKAYHFVYTIAKEHGCVLLNEDQTLQAAKNWAVGEIMSSYEETDWIWDYLVAVYGHQGEARNFRCSFANPCEAHERDDSYVIYESLVAERDKLMLFANIVMSNSPKKWLITSDFDGGQLEAYVYTGDAQGAEWSALWTANAIAGVNGLYELDQEKWVFTDYQDLIKNVGTSDNDEFWKDHDCAPIYRLSIEEV